MWLNWQVMVYKLVLVMHWHNLMMRNYLMVRRHVVLGNHMTMVHSRGMVRRGMMHHWVMFFGRMWHWLVQLFLVLGLGSFCWCFFFLCRFW